MFAARGSADFPEPEEVHRPTRHEPNSLCTLAHRPRALKRARLAFVPGWCYAANSAANP
jgi:hypothetical protein